jgi:hypothetical protein
LRFVLTGNQIRLQRIGFLEAVYAHDAEADDVAFDIHTFHHGIVLGFLLVTAGVRKSPFEIIGFRVEPDFYFGGHKSSPAFSLSVS